MAKYAVTHPGKIGDALYTLPTIRYLAEKSGSPVDFYTSEYCLPIKELFEYQSCIDKFIVPEDYVIKGYDMGVQPYAVPVPRGAYDTVFHLGFRSIPNKRLDWWMAESVGINPLELPPISYEIPPHNRHLITPYIVLAPRGETSYKSLFLDFMLQANQHGIGIVQIGAKGEFIGKCRELDSDYTGLNLLDTCGLIAGAKGFVGLMSAMLVLANGYPLPKVVPHNNKSWDMRHVVNSPSNFYMVDPDASELLEIIEGT